MSPIDPSEKMFLPFGNAPHWPPMFAFMVRAFSARSALNKRSSGELGGIAGEAGTTSGDESNTSDCGSRIFCLAKLGDPVTLEADLAANLGTGRLVAAGEAENVAPAYRISSFTPGGIITAPLEADCRVLVCVPPGVACFWLGEAPPFVSAGLCFCLRDGRGDAVLE
jgi:hypothetical protein